MRVVAVNFWLIQQKVFTPMATAVLKDLQSGIAPHA
jgi:hypothetical protein